MARLMPNVGGPSNRKREVLMTVAMSSLFYAALIWAGIAVKTERNRRELSKAHGLAALRRIRAYRTVSGEAAAVLAGSLPPDLATKESACPRSLKNGAFTEEEFLSQYGREI